jgi:hypothetical protein
MKSQSPHAASDRTLARNALAEGMPMADLVRRDGSPLLARVGVHILRECIRYADLPPKQAAAEAKRLQLDEAEKLLEAHDGAR